jgi:serine/threonine protein kinase/Tfp pilus assembly protein PilF
MDALLGKTLSHYRVEEKIGAGGMGEVYRARDTRLDRTVAIKALPTAVAGDPTRLARFEREAKLLASLSHPNIAAIYGLEHVDGALYLVLEFIQGENLAQRLAKGPLGIAEALDIGGQVASAIEAAHERGIVHRDLKPGNVMVMGPRTVKVLDFGLAKGDGSTAAPQALSNSPTMQAATGAGIVLGTAPYMSPEQARGKEVDRRTDVWAFGCLLFECLSGRQAFSGETASDVIARILEREPDWSPLPPSTPPRLRDLLERCLTKDVEQRPRDIGDLRRQLGSIAQELSSPGRAAAHAATERPSLAVLYFENLANDPESGYFCAGITEDILTDISKIKGLRVASRNAVARYRGAPADIAKVASELGVKAVLEGSVRKAGDRVRITAQLINAADGFHLWAERYDRTLQDVFTVQEEIASSIATALRVALSPAETKDLVRDRPDDARAYDLYLKGRARYGSYTAESLRDALNLFQRATEIDRDYALAWAGIADCYGQMIQWGVAKDVEEVGRLGLEAARKAIALNPRLPEGHKAESLVLRYMGDTAGARVALMKALEANPRFAPALINLAVDSFDRADLAGAERLIRRVLDLDAQDAFALTWLGALLIYTGRYDQAIAAATRVRTLSSDTFYITASYLLRAWAHLQRGELDAAEQAVHEGAGDGADSTNLMAVEAMLAARRNRLEEAGRILRGIKDSTTLAAGTVSVAAGAAARVGDPELAARFLDHVRWTRMGPVMVRLDPELHPYLDRAPWAPPRLDVALIWPLEAPMIDPARHALFKEVRIESGMPQGSDLQASR